MTKNYNMNFILGGHIRNGLFLRIWIEGFKGNIYKIRCISKDGFL